MQDIYALAYDPNAWAALITLVVLEVVLGIDNLIFISILTNKLPEEMRRRARAIGISLALGLRLALLASLVFLAHITQPLFDLGLAGPADDHGKPSFETAFSLRDLIMVAGGLFLVWKATREIHEHVDHTAQKDETFGGRVAVNFGSAIVQILLLDLVFSIDSILTAVGMTEHLPIMVVAVVIAVTLMLIASGPLARFIHHNPTVVMLALGFLLMIGMVLIADGFGVHVPKGYIYGAMGFSAFVEGLNMLSRRARTARDRAGELGGGPQE